MSIVALAFAGTAVLSAVGLVAWVGFAMDRAVDDLRSFVELAPPFADTVFTQYSIARPG